MVDYFFWYALVILAFLLGFFWNARREKVSTLVENDTQFQMEAILEMDKERIQSLGFH